MITRRNMCKSALLLLLLMFQVTAYSQAPQGFSYQGVAKNSNGTPIANQTIGISISLQNSSFVVFYSETHSTQTNAQGLFNIIIGSGTKTSLGLFKDIPWANGDVRLSISIDIGTGFVPLGNPTPIQSVPFALYAESAKEIVSSGNASDTDPIFVVKNKLDQVVFAVYQTGIRAYVADTSVVKGAKGGFAIGGLTSKSISETQDYFSITPYSARISLNQTVKGAKGGFAVGGLTGKGKYSNGTYMQLTPDNYFIGQDAGSSITTGKFNSFLGFESGKFSTEGSDNVFIGYQAGLKNTTGWSNNFIGVHAGRENTTGYYNIFIGINAGSMNSEGSSNLFIGNNAGALNTIGSGNMFIGHNSASNNVDGSNNLFVGANTGMYNVSGSGNTFLGSASGQNNVSGLSNTFLGEGSGFDNLDGRNNTALGAGAAHYIKNNCNNNTFLGSGSGTSVVNNSSDNVFIGSRSAPGLTQGNSNIMIGKFAGAINSGNYNVFIGDYTGNTIDDANNNVLIGYCAGQKITGSGNVMIGSNAGQYTSCNNKLFISNSSHDSTNVLIYGEFDKQTLTFNAKVGIGTTQPDKQLHVVGDARITGDLYYGSGTNIYQKPDFVFLSNYKNYMDPLCVDEFIKSNGHLPWLTKSTNEIEGVNLTRMQFETVETVENLQLQIIELKKESQLQIDKQQQQIKILSDENSILKNKFLEIDSLKAELEAIKTLLKK